jgi:hypothetical protein
MRKYLVSGGNTYPKDVNMNSSWTFFWANNQRPLIILFSCHWATVMTACFVAHSNRLSTLSLCLESLRHRTPSNLKLTHISKNPSKKDEAPLPNKALCTPKHNGKSGNDQVIDTDSGEPLVFSTYLSHCFPGRTKLMEFFQVFVIKIRLF